MFPIDATEGDAMTLEELVDRARALVEDSASRAVLGVCGAPGSGKSTFADAFVAAYGASAVVVPMDGFHLHDDELRHQGLLDRKGAPATFDVHGYLSLLARLRSETATTVYAPRFDRAHETAVAGAVAVRPEHRLVVTEGNYLLHDAPPWREVAAHLAECWYVHESEDLRLERLVQRHVDHGKTREEAERWVERSDQPNARLVLRTRPRAGLVVDWAWQDV